ncbi:MAG: hypothetical protein ABW019_18400 [Chitinophagaceae bacterium]
MFNLNVGNQLFLTSPGQGLGTSVYYVLPNKLIRAKTNANELHVRPLKNLYFIRPVDVNFFYDAIDLLATWNPLSGFVIYQQNNFGAGVTVVPDQLHTIPADMYLDGAGYYQSGLHIGHPITNQFNGYCQATGTVFTFQQVIDSIALHVNDVAYGDYTISTNMPI